MNPPMTVPWKTVRVFISSTFRDMQAERDWLVRFVFPRLREELLRHRIHLVDVDLRWGVTSDQDAQGVCREVIDECRPRFMCILGGRYGWVPPGCNRSITADEVLYGVLDRLEGHGRTYFYFRDPQATAEMVEETPGEFRELPGSSGDERLLVLKRSIVDAGLTPFIYSAQWDSAHRRLVGLEVFAEKVFSDLLESLQRDPEFSEHFSDATGSADEFADEDAAIEAFIEKRADRFVIGSRKSLLDAMVDFARSEGVPNVLVITGDSGSGKSALLSKFCQALGSPTDMVVAPHFVGASSGSTDLRQTLRRFCHALAPTQSLPEDTRELIQLFGDLLAGGNRQVVLIIDAVNQFDASHFAHSMYWLPTELRPNVRVIISSLEHPALEVLRARTQQVREETLEPLLASDIDAIIAGFLQRYHKRVNPEQLAALTAKRDAHLPLYLLTALDELRTLGTYEEITLRIRELPNDTQALFVWIFKERLAKEQCFRDAGGRLCGADLVEKFACYVGVSRHGLSASELASLLAPSTPDDPLGNVAALLRLFRPYLMWRGGLLDFFHTQVHEAVGAEFLETPQKRLAAHRNLALQFQQDADPRGDSSYSGANPHALSELPYQLTHAACWEELISLLTDFRFMLAKCAAGLSDDLLLDFERAVGVVPWAPALRDWQSFLASNRHLLSRGTDDSPADRILIQRCAEQEKGSRFSRAVYDWLAEDGKNHVGLRRIPLEGPVSKECVRVFEGHEGSVLNACLLSGDRVLSCSNDATLRVWDLVSGLCTTVLSKHAHVLRAREVTKGRVISVSSDSYKLWDLESGAIIESGSSAELHDRHPEWIEPKSDSLEPRFRKKSRRESYGDYWQHLLLADGREVHWKPGPRDVRLAYTRTLSLYLCSEETEIEFSGHRSFVNGACLVPDLRLISWSEDGTLRLWRLESNAGCEAIFTGHHGPVHGALPLNERQVLSWSEDGTLRLWDSTLCDGRAEGRSHGAVVSRTMLFPSKARLASWSLDPQDARHEILLWNLESGRCIGGVEFPSEVDGAELLDDGRLLCWSRMHCGWYYPPANLGEPGCSSVYELLDAESGMLLEPITQEQAYRLYPKLKSVEYREEERVHGGIPGPEVVQQSDRGVFTNESLKEGELSVRAEGRTVVLQIGILEITWHAPAQVDVRHILPDGTVVALVGSKVCVLEPFGGSRALASLARGV